jgi:hypothetical protein
VLPVVVVAAFIAAIIAARDPPDRPGARDSIDRRLPLGSMDREGRITEEETEVEGLSQKRKQQGAAEAAP